MTNHFVSEVERTFYEVQDAIAGGNARWEDLDPITQMQFTHAVSVILEICSIEVTHE